MATNLRPQSSANSAPMSSLMPAIFFVAECARTTPANEHSSVMASAVYPSSFACETSSSACDAPRRKLKLLRQCSSAYWGLSSFPLANGDGPLIEVRPRLLGNDECPHSSPEYTLQEPLPRSAFVEHP